MADIHQWRRMIQPARSRTPAADTDDSDGFAFLSPTTPRKGLKPKLSSYFTQPSTLNLPSRSASTYTNDTFREDLHPWSTNYESPDPDADRLIDSIMSRLLAEPYYSLDSRFNGNLLRIFECFRNMKDEKHDLQLHLEREVERRTRLELAMQDSAERFERERQEFRAEIKRLEVLLAKGERGVAEVTLARQDSLLRYGQRIRDNIKADKTLETVFEFLERTRTHVDKRWSSQRATMKKGPTSPSVSMRRLSEAYRNHSSILPDGTPGDVSLLERARHTTDRFPTLDHAKTVQLRNGRSNLERSFGISEPRTSSSADTLSTFSCDGDLLPDEAVDTNVLDIARSLAETNLAKHPRLRRKATEYYAGWKPQLNVDTTSTGRRFSFEPGDDNDTALSAPPLEKLPAAVKHRLLRKSVSMSVLSERTPPKAHQRESELSPVQQSPTTSVPPSDIRKPTRIPTPIHGNGSLARPRREREDSSSSK